jgi:hypothetical protein
MLRGGASDAWWTCGKNKNHNPIKDCNLYIKNFRIREYIKELKGAFRFWAGRDASTDLSKGGLELDIESGDSYIEAACRVMIPHLNEIDEAAGKSINIRRIYGMSTESVDEMRRLLLVAFIAASAMTRGTEEVKMRLVSQMIKEIKNPERRPELNFGSPTDLIIGLAKAADKFSEGRISIDLQTQVQASDQSTKIPSDIGPQLISFRTVDAAPCQIQKGEGGMIDRLNRGKGPNGDPDGGDPYRFGAYPEIRTSGYVLRSALDSDSRPITIEDPDEAIRACMKEMLEGAIAKTFEWDDLRHEWSAQISGASVPRYKLVSAIVMTEWNGAREYLTLHWPSDNPTEIFVKGKRWKEAFRKSVDKPAELGEIVSLYYQRIS